MTGYLCSSNGFVINIDVFATNLEKKATRDGYGAGLADLGETNTSIVVLEADLSGSTKTRKFADKFPDRFFNFGVAEQNLIGQAAGFALAGLTPIASSFAIFATGRAWEIVRNSVAYPKLNVKIAATHAGITLGEDGASHQIIEDLALMRVIPDMTVLVPSDYYQAYNTIRAAVEHKGPVYIRLGRPNIPVIYDKKTPVTIGGCNILQEGNCKIAFLATGVMVFEAYKAAKILEKEKGIIPHVLDIYSVKPLPEKEILSAAQNCDQLFTFEEHNILAGFGSAVAELVSAKMPRKITRIGLNDVFGQSGTTSDLMNYYGLTAEKLVERISAEV